MADTISKIKIKQDPKQYNLKDDSAIKKIIFNGREYTTSLEKENTIVIEDSFINELKLNKILIKNISKYGDEVEFVDNGLYIVKERDNEKFSGYSLFVTENSQVIRLTTPTILFETENIDFQKLLKNNNIEKFMTWDKLMYKLEIGTVKKQIVGKDDLGNSYNDVTNGIEHDVYFCKFDLDEDTYNVTPYIVFKTKKDTKEYVIKSYVKENIDGSLSLLEGKVSSCSFGSSSLEKNEFARQVEVD